MSDMAVTNPLSGENENLFVAMADPVEEKLLHMVTADPARTPTFTPFAQGDYFLNALPATPTPCANNDLSNCVFLPTSTPPNQTFAWNHGGVQPEVASTWVGFVGPGIEKNAKLDDDFFSDHTDLRPTMLSLLGLKDSYVSDGRVLTEILKADAIAEVTRAHGDAIDDLGQAYKQIIASFGQFSMDTLAASTGALASDTPGDATYSDTESALRASARARRPRWRSGSLWNAEFNDQKLDKKQAKDWIEQADDLLDRAPALAAPFAAVSDQKTDH